MEILKGIPIKYVCARFKQRPQNAFTSKSYLGLIGQQWPPKMWKCESLCSLVDIHFIVLGALKSLYPKLVHRQSERGGRQVFRNVNLSFSTICCVKGPKMQ